MSVEMASKCESLPVLYIKARSNFDVGFQIGKTFNHFIREHTLTETAETLYSFYKTNEGRKLYDASLETTKKCYPHIVEEIRGMAEGSGVSFEKLFLQDMVSEILLCHTNPKLTNDNKAEKEIAGCSDILVNNGQCRILAHNEDWGTEVESKMFMVDVELDRSTSDESDNKAKGEKTDAVHDRIASRNERYLAFMFPGYLAGNTFYVNKFFGASVNSLVPQTANHGAVPVDILIRAMIGCETIEECVSVMKNDPVGCSYGINVNIASRHSKDMWSLEVYAHNGKTVVDVKQIDFSNSGVRDSYYVHTNHYKHIDDVDEVASLEGSKAREDTANKMDVPQNVQDTCSVLGDTSNTIEPIYRRPGTSLYSKHVATLATAVFDMNKSVLHVYLQNPKRSKKPSLTLPFTD